MIIIVSSKDFVIKERVDMKKSILFATDYDHTLFRGKDIAAEDLMAISKLREKGGKFGLVSGRAVSSLLNEVKKYNIPYDFLIGVNGGIAIDSDNEELYKYSIDMEDAYAIKAYFDEIKPSSYTLHDGYAVARKIFVKDFDLNLNLEFCEFEDIFATSAMGFFSHFEDATQAQIIAQEMNRLFLNVDAQQNSRFVDVTAKNIHKARGIEEMLKIKGWTDEVWVIGDAENDQSMIEQFNSFAMSDGNEKLKVSADYVVDTVSEAINKLI